MHGAVQRDQGPDRKSLQSDIGQKGKQQAEGTWETVQNYKGEVCSQHKGGAAGSCSW